MSYLDFPKFYFLDFIINIEMRQQKYENLFGDSFWVLSTSVLYVII